MIFVPLLPVNDIQPIWNKICVNLQKRMISPPEYTKVLLGYVVIYVKIYDNISEYTLVLRGPGVPRYHLAQM